MLKLPGREVGALKNRSAIRNMAYISLGAVILAVGAWITVPFAVPFTMQTFALYLLLNVFGGRRTSFSVVLYIAMGLAGLPVFSGFNSGLPVLLGSTGGFVVGFLVAGCLYFALDSTLSRNKHLGAVLPFATLLACYGCGTVWYMFYCASVGTTVGVVTAVSICVLPYILPDCIKILLALSVAERIRPLVS